MNSPENPSPSPVPPSEPAPPSAAAPLPPPSPAVPAPMSWLLPGAIAAVLAVAITVALVMTWNTQQRLRAAEQEIARRQQDAGSQAVEARTLARQAEATARDTAARLALLEARVAETALQRGQLEELLQSLSRSRDENVLADVDAALRVAIQQSAITGSVEPLVGALRQADERLARYQQPRLERVRRAALQDLDKVRAAGGIDLTTLTLRIDEVIRLVDELPLVAAATRRPGQRDAPDARPVAPAASAAAGPASAAAASASAPAAGPWAGALRELGAHVWDEVRSLIRVTRIDHPEAALIAPDQAFFLRENLKLRLLNARLAILSRQFDTAQSDLREAQRLLERHFDRNSRRVVAVGETLRQVGGQARQVVVPRPEATLAAIAAAAAGR